MMFAHQKLFNTYSEVTPLSGLLVISAHILAPFQKLQSFNKWGNAMDINPDEKTLFTMQCDYAFLKYVENEYCAKQ
jgi:hypothetical protein